MPPLTTTRAMTAEERALLERPEPKLFGWWTGIVSAVCVFLLTFVAAALSALVLPFTVAIRGSVAMAAVSAVSSYVWIQRRARGRRFARSARVAAEIASGRVRSTIYDVTDAVAVEEAEDEGPSYYLLLDDGRTLFLSGQYLYEPVDSGFPWESFEVVRVPSGQWVIRVVPLGPPLTPSGTRAPFSFEDGSAAAV